MESESSEIHGNRSDCDCDCWKLCCRPRAGHLNPLFSNILVKPQLFTVSIDKSFLGLFLITTKPMFVSVSGFQEFSLWLMEFFLCLRLGWKKAVWKTRVKAKLPSLKNVIQIRDKAEEDTLPYWFQITTNTHTWGFLPMLYKCVFFLCRQDCPGNPATISTKTKNTPMKIKPDTSCWPRVQ